MSVAKDFTMSDGLGNKLSYAIENGTFGARLFSYIFLATPIALVIIGLFAIMIEKYKFGNSIFIDVFSLFFSCLISSLPFIIKEKMIRRRRKEGLPIYESIEKILKQRAIDERVMMEVKAQEKVSPNKDLNYYFELLKKGAITQEEYDAKKAEFLK